MVSVGLCVIPVDRRCGVGCRLGVVGGGMGDTVGRRVWILLGSGLWSGLVVGTGRRSRIGFLLDRRVRSGLIYCPWWDALPQIQAALVEPVLAAQTLDHGLSLARRVIRGRASTKQPARTKVLAVGIVRVGSLGR